MDLQDLLGCRVDVVTTKGLRERIRIGSLRRQFLDVDIVWSAVENDLPNLKQKVTMLLKEKS